MFSGGVRTDWGSGAHRTLDPAPFTRARAQTPGPLARDRGSSNFVDAVRLDEFVPARVATVDAIARIGYVPNLLAGGLASTRSRLVAAVVPTIAGPVFLETVQSLTESLAERGYQLMLGQSGYSGSREDALLEAIIGRRPDGIVLTGIMHSAEGRRRLLASGIPVVETWDLTADPIDMVVGFSNRDAGRAIARYLLDKGHRRIGFAGGGDHRTRARLAGFEAALRRVKGACLSRVQTDV